MSGDDELASELVEDGELKAATAAAAAAAGCHWPRFIGPFDGFAGDEVTLPAIAWPSECITLGGGK